MVMGPCARRGRSDCPVPPPNTAISAAPALLARVVGIDPSAAQGLLAYYGSLGALRQAETPDLRKTHGLTARQATRLRDALDLATSVLVEPRVERPQVTSPRDAARLMLPEMGCLEQEQMRVLLLDTKHQLIATVPLYTGTVAQCQVRVAEMFREAVRRNASALILVHNHPSGVADPSPDDIQVTRAVVQAGRLLDVDVLDHLVVAQDMYTSMRERGLGWT